jgi:hypothetical protein
MALTQKSRSDAYEGLRSIMNEQSAEELLAHFPSRDLDEPVTREFVHAEIAGVRTEIAGERTEIAEVDKRLTTQIAEVDKRLSTQIAGLDKRLSTQIAGLDKRLSTQIAEVDKRLSAQIAGLPNEIAPHYTRHTYAILGAIGVATTILGILLTAGAN